MNHEMTMVSASVSRETYEKARKRLVILNELTISKKLELNIGLEYGEYVLGRYLIVVKRKQSNQASTDKNLSLCCKKRVIFPFWNI